MKRLLLALALSACSGTAYIPPPSGPPPEPITVTVDVASPPTAAYDRAVSALTSSGYVIGEGSRDAGLVKTTVIPGESVVRGGLVVVTVRTEYFIRATISPTDAGSRVAFTATMQGTTRAGSSEETFPETPVSGCASEGSADALQICRDRLTRVRGWLENVASKLR